MARIPFAFLLLLTVLATWPAQHQQQQQPRSPNPSPNPFHHHLSSLLTAREASSSCKQCNRAFCLKYNLPICKDAEDKDIKTSCFQRDSHKDQVIVWGFLLGTAGLLGWAGARRVVARVRERRGRMMQQAQAGEGRFGGSGSGHDDRGMGGVGRALGLFNGRGPEDRGAYSPLEEQHGGGVVRGPG
ncbi:hypothetical protein NEMBOFW57_008756 [Staphylotrichum longicolle]|uniref:Uncharacterized protein n=1 Tax=Staphylotrichum longicolle TaxID=669026 RepID=A0AAD4ESL4_9PEZI|nr:hypothetical protein NEMBOFW57_008756 [Staphylotrichum longicolle]